MASHTPSGGNWIVDMSHTDGEVDAGFITPDNNRPHKPAPEPARLTRGRPHERRDFATASKLASRRPIYQEGNKDEFWTSKPQFKFYPDLLTGGRNDAWPAPPEPKLMAALGEVGTRLIIADMVQDIIVKNMAAEEAVKKAHDAMVEVFKARGANV